MAPPLAGNSFDLSAYAAKTVGVLVREDKLEESLKCFEEEKKKIEAYEYELPLCMKLITSVIDELKKEMERLHGKRFDSVLQEFMHVKSKYEEKCEPDSIEKKNWMSSAQLWTDNSTTDKQKSSKIEDNIEKTNGSASDRRSIAENSSPESKPQSYGKAPVLAPAVKVYEKTVSALPDLSLASPAMKAARQLSENEHQTQIPQQTTRKRRRCWSPELHRRFLFALQQLGGAHVATPKHIRELMKVDGLTNDEVKSHLQKYRLHARRIPDSSASIRKPTVVMGGHWASLVNCSPNSPRGIVSDSASPENPLQLTVSDRTISTTVEDGKSEGYSWK